MPSIVELENEWRAHAPWRASGGRWALDGFRFQLVDSLVRLVERLKRGQPPEAMAFEGLSDLSFLEGDILTLIQMKTRMDRKAAKSAAAEAIAIHRFLEDAHPELLPKVRYEVVCRSLGPDPASLSAEDLELAPAQAGAWAIVRTRMSPPAVRADPYVALVAALFPIVRNASLAASALLGDLVRRLSDHEDAGTIVSALVDRVAAERRQDEPVGSILVPENFERRPEGTSILLGQSPKIAHLAQGRFMERDSLAAGAAASIARSLGTGAGAGADAGGDDPGDDDAVDEDGIAVHWLTGTSGAGKSVLLLQTLERLVTDGACLVHHIPPYPKSLHQALSQWREREDPIVIALDDLYVPGRRGEEVWHEILAVALDGRWGGRVAVVTAGPDEYRHEFQQLGTRDGAFRVMPIPVPKLDQQAREDFRAWYSARTGAATEVDEELFVVAALLAELRRQGDPTVDAFALRFRERCRDLELQDAVLAALAMNQLGLPAPAALFADRLDQLNLLFDEGVIQGTDEDGDELLVFHQQVARLIYQPLVPEAATHQRARHLLSAFVAWPVGHPKRLALLDLLQRGPKGLPLGAATRAQVVAEVGDSIWADDHPSYEEVVRWVFAGIRVRYPFASSPLTDRLVRWSFDDEPRAVAPVVRVLWRCCPDRHAELVERGQRWLEEHPEEPAWSAVFLEMHRRTGAADRLLAVAERFLAAHPRAAGWPAVFVRVHERRAQPPAVMESGLMEAPVEPRDDERLWAAAEQLLERSRFLVLLAPRACRAPGRSTIVAGIATLDRLMQPEHVDAVRSALAQEAATPGLAHFARIALSTRPAGSPVVEAVRPVAVRWLTEHPDAPDWPSTWLAVFRAGRAFSGTTARLFEIADAWLPQNREHPGWLPIVLRMLEQRPDATAAHLEDWVRSEVRRREWLHVWLRVHPHLPDGGREGAINWLARAPRSPRWLEVHDHVTPDPDEALLLHEATLTWLSTHFRAPPWLRVFAGIEAGVAATALAEAARPWLRARQRHPAWWWVLIRAARDAPLDPELADLAERWIDANGGSVGVEPVRERLARAPAGG